MHVLTQLRSLSLSLSLSHSHSLWLISWHIVTFLILSRCQRSHQTVIHRRPDRQTDRYTDSDTYAYISFKATEKFKSPFRCSWGAQTCVSLGHWHCWQQANCLSYCYQQWTSNNQLHDQMSQDLHMFNSISDMLIINPNTCHSNSLNWLWMRECV